MVELKQKPAGKPVHTADKAHLPRTAMHAVWLCTREGTRRLVAEEHRDGQYQEAAAQEERAVDAVASATETAVGTALRSGKKLAQQVAQKRRSEKAAERTMDIGTRPPTDVPGNPDSRNTAASPYYKRRNRQSQPARRRFTAFPTQIDGNQVRQAEAANLHQSRLRHDSLARFQVTTRRKAQPQQAPLPKTVSAAGKKSSKALLAQTRTAKTVQRAKQAAQAAGSAAKKTADAVMAGLKALWAATHTLVLAIAAGGTVAVLVVVIVCMIALVIGSGFGIFFAAEPAGDGMSLADAITQLNGEYQDRLEEIENDHPHDRLAITSNDGSYAIAWQDVLAVFAARTSGAEDGAPVAYLDEANLERLRQIMWDMNEVIMQDSAQNFYSLNINGSTGNANLYREEASNDVDSAVVFENVEGSHYRIRLEHARSNGSYVYLTAIGSGNGSSVTTNSNGTGRAKASPARHPCASKPDWIRCGPKGCIPAARCATATGLLKKAG